jgi:RNase P subunit RPR2
VEQLVCVKCGEPLGRMSGIREAIESNPKLELLSQCSCGQKYKLRLLTSDPMVLSFSEGKVEVMC